MPMFDTPDPITLHARGKPDHPACHDIATNRVWTYAQLHADIRRMAGLLQQTYGIDIGDRVAVIAGNSAELVMLQFALERLDAIFVPLNHRLTAHELTDIVADCQPSLLVTDRSEGLPECPPACRIASVDEIRQQTAQATPLLHGIAPAADATRVILYTSGTSGQPKGVLITAENLYATAVNFGIIGKVGRDCVFLCDAPFFHVIGLIATIRPPILFGGTIHIAPKFDPARTNALLADADVGVTHYFCVPKMAEMLTEQDNFKPQEWRTLTGMFTGGSPIFPHVIRWWLERGVLVSNGLGMTEAGGTIAHVPLEPDTIDRHAGGVGLPPPFMALRIVDAEEHDLPAGEPGEILIRGPNVTPGYWQRPATTQAAFTDDGWLRTGDIGQVDADGFLTLRDRKKNMFISGGENIYPAEVENTLVQHPDIAEVCVIGVDDPQWGEVGHAYLVARPETDIDMADVRRYCRERLASYKVPKYFDVIDAIPRNANGKMMRNQLAEDSQP